MRIFRSFEEAGGLKNPVVTTGSFDGVHIGHKSILNRLRMLADKYNGESVLITFHPHPRKVLYPETAGRDLRLINSQEEKIYLLEKAGLDNVIIIKFTLEFSKVTSEQFVRDYLSNALKSRVVVVGFNHHFGFNKEGDYRQLWGWREKYNFEAEEIPEQEVEHETVSSTRIRRAISEGYIQRANAYLDHYYIVIGKTLKFSCDICRELPSFFNIDFQDESKLLPSPGIYAVTAETGNISSKAMGIVLKGSDNKSLLVADIFEQLPFGNDKRIRLSFHKKVQGAVNLNEQSNVQRILSARNEISELIY